MTTAPADVTTDHNEIQRAVTAMVGILRTVTLPRIAAFSISPATDGTDAYMVDLNTGYDYADAAWIAAELGLAPQEPSQPRGGARMWHSRFSGTIDGVVVEVVAVTASDPRGVDV